MPTGRPPLRPSPRTRTIRPKRTYGARLTEPSTRLPWLRGNRVIGIVLLVIAAALIPTHLAEHANVFDPLPGNLEDLLLGFPMAAVLGIAAFISFIWRD
jgi:hypothetical protein